jgi:hypothetical protein
MKKSIKVVPKKRRGRPATGKDPHLAARMPPALIAEVEAWAGANNTTRSEAVRRLVEVGLSAAKTTSPTSAKTSARAKEMAGQAIDKLADPQASTEEKAGRKGRLIKGPEEFREVRVDRSKK